MCGKKPLLEAGNSFGANEIFANRRKLQRQRKWGEKWLDISVYLADLTPARLENCNLALLSKVNWPK